MTDPQRSVRVVIRGQVQMVWFRAWTRQRAQELGLAGWVRNRDDGAVEAVFRGEGDLVDQMTQACHAGPPMAEVQSVTVSDHTERVGSGFAVR